MGGSRFFKGECLIFGIQSLQKSFRFLINIFMRHVVAFPNDFVSLINH